MAFGIPVTPDFDDYTFTVGLDGIVYQITIRWNSRMEKWCISLALEDGTEVVGMRPIIADWPPFARFRNNLLPAGELIFIDTSGKNIDPDHTDLGTRVLLIYLEAEDLVA